MNNLALRYHPKVMAARHEPPPNANHWAKVVTPQTRFGAGNPSGRGDLSAPLCSFDITSYAGESALKLRFRNPFVVNDTTASLASRVASQIVLGARLNYPRTNSIPPI
jgi:hypothetical protein